MRVPSEPDPPGAQGEARKEPGGLSEGSSAPKELLGKGCSTMIPPSGICEQVSVSTLPHPSENADSLHLAKGSQSEGTHDQPNYWAQKKSGIQADQGRWQGNQMGRDQALD
jgi:hypothetical protein